MTRITFYLLVPFLMVQLSQAQTSQLQKLVQEALKNNPGLQARSSMVKAREARVPSQGALPDPMITFGLMNLPLNTFVFDQEPMTGKQLAFSQAIPFPGKLGLKEKMAEQDARLARFQFEDVRLKLIFQVKQAYFDLNYIDRALEVTQKNQEILQNFIEVAQTKYSVGKGIQQDVLKAQVEFAKFYDKIITLKDKREGINARLNALLNRSANTPFPDTEALLYKPLKVEFDSLMNIALKNNPILNGYATRVQKSDFKNRLAKKNYMPDFNVMVAYTQRDVLSSGMGGIDYVSGIIGLKIPLYFWKKQRKDVESSYYEKESNTQALENIRNTVLSRLSDAYQSMEKEAELIDLYQTTIIPQSSQALNSAISSYQTDKVDFLTLLNNLMVLFNYEKEYYRILSSYYKDIAQLEYLTGSTLTN